MKHLFKWACLLACYSAATEFAKCEIPSKYPTPPIQAPARANLPEKALKRVEAFWNQHLPGYMNGTSEPISYPGWEGYPTRKHHYKMDDGKKAEVIMCNADAKQLARWIVTATLEAKGSTDPKDLDKLSRAILEASGAQFPVAGIVFENMDGQGNALFVFREGVTVRIPGIQNGSRVQPSQSQIEASMDPKIQPLEAKIYARIQSTTREEYKKAGGTENVEGTAWLAVSKKLYQAAWGNDRNELMIAWAKSHL